MLVRLPHPSLIRVRILSPTHMDVLFCYAVSRAQTEEWKGWMQWAFIMVSRGATMGTDGSADCRMTFIVYGYPLSPCVLVTPLLVPLLSRLLRLQ